MGDKKRASTGTESCPFSVSLNTGIASSTKTAVLKPTPKAQPKTRLELPRDANTQVARKMPQDRSPSHDVATLIGAQGFLCWGVGGGQVPASKEQVPQSGHSHPSRHSLPEQGGQRLSWHREKLLLPHRGWPCHLRAITLELPTWGMPAWHINVRFS